MGKRQMNLIDRDVVEDRNRPKWHVRGHPKLLGDHVHCIQSTSIRLAVIDGRVPHIKIRPLTGRVIRDLVHVSDLALGHIAALKLWAALGERVPLVRTLVDVSSKKLISRSRYRLSSRHKHGRPMHNCISFKETLNNKIRPIRWPFHSPPLSMINTKDIEPIQYTSKRDKSPRMPLEKELLAPRPPAKRGSSTSLEIVYRPSNRSGVQGRGTHM
jgi:hypothetical protein